MAKRGFWARSNRNSVTAATGFRWSGGLHRKNALFYRTLNGAQVGDLSMSLIHTAELCGANSFDYLTELQRHAEMTVNPTAWMPWNYRETLQAAGV